MWATYWAENVNYYSDFYTWFILPLYVIILLIGSWLAGGYDKPLRTGRIIQGMAFGALGLLVFYSLMNETLRFSRAIVLLGSMGSIAATLGIRGLLSLAGVDGYRLFPTGSRRYLIVGSESEQQRVIGLFDSLGIVPRHVATFGTADIDAIRNISRQENVNEIIFCGKDISVSQILDISTALKENRVTFRIAPKEMDVLIGSNYTSSTDELYSPDFSSVACRTNRRSKRIFDIITSALLLLLSPILFWFQKRKRR